jgi:hypothetical protein
VLGTCPTTWWGQNRVQPGYKYSPHPIRWLLDHVPSIDGEITQQTWWALQAELRAGPGDLISALTRGAGLAHREATPASTICKVRAQLEIVQSNILMAPIYSVARKNFFKLMLPPFFQSLRSLHSERYFWDFAVGGSMPKSQT